MRISDWSSDVCSSDLITSVSVRGNSILHNTTVHGDLAVDGQISAASIVNTTGRIQSSVDVNLTTDQAWSSALNINFYMGH